MSQAQSRVPPKPLLKTVISRDVNASEASPLTYRERSYCVDRSFSRAELEPLLQSELSGLRATLANRPRGQLIRLAVFDHTFTDKPARAPLATLEWKDWVDASALGLITGQVARSDNDEIDGGPGSHTRLRPVATSTDPSLPAALPLPVPALALPAPALPAPVPALPSPVPAVLSAAMPVSTVQVAVHEPEHDDGHDPRLASAFEALQDLYFLSTAAEALEFGVSVLGQLIPCAALGGAIYDINTDELRFVSVAGACADARRAVAVTASAGLLGLAMHSHRETFTVSDADKDPRFVGNVDGVGGLSPRELLYLPLTKSDNLLGVLQLVNPTHGGGYSRDDLAVAAYVAGQVAEFLQSRRQVVRRRR